MSDERFDRIDDWQKRADQRFDVIDAGLECLSQRVDVLYEEALSRIATGAPRLPTKREMDARFDELRELLTRQIEPLDATSRNHSPRIAALEKKRR